MYNNLFSFIFPFPVSVYSEEQIKYLEININIQFLKTEEMLLVS